MCKPNFIHVCFIIDESGSMYGSESDIIGGFNKTIEEQKSVKDGQCSVSFFSFDTNVRERFIGKDVNDVKKLTKGNNCSFLHTLCSFLIKQRLTPFHVSFVKATIPFAASTCTTLAPAFAAATVAPPV